MGATTQPCLATARGRAVCRRTCSFPALFDADVDTDADADKTIDEEYCGSESRIFFVRSDSREINRQ